MDELDNRGYAFIMTAIVKKMCGELGSNDKSNIL
jgi:Na+/H+ antiporter NhaD/arsenite permease-like protein